MIDHQSALIYVMVMVSAADRNMMLEMMKGTSKTEAQFSAEIKAGGVLAVEVQRHLAGAERQFLALPALRQPGRYRLRVDMTDEQHAYFFQTGSEPLVWELEVP